VRAGTAPEHQECIPDRVFSKDNWLLTPLNDSERRDILEVIEDRIDHRSTLVAGQLPVAEWHAAIGEPTLADAICDRLLHDAHRLALTGPTMRDLRDRAASMTEATS
jgi:DNA replication protein DnaC